MDNTPLQAFVGKVLASRRLLYADLQRLQRDILPDGLRSSAEAEALIALEGVLDRVDEGWAGYLSAALREFVLSSSRPPGTIDARTAVWLVSAFSRLPRPAAIAMAREVALEARQVDSALLVFLGKGSKGRAKPSAVACRQALDPRISYWPGKGYEWGTVSIKLGEGSEIPLNQALSPSFG